MIVGDEAFDELLDFATRAEEYGGEGRRRVFVLEVDRAVSRALRRDEGVPWHAATLRRFGCRLHFFRHLGSVFLVACVPVGDVAPGLA